MSNSKVSVFMPAYNQQAFVGSAIESVLNQTHTNFELIIGDDCSTDDTWRIIQDYHAAHPQNIVAYRNDQNLGIPENCSKLIAQCRGDYIAFHAGDDLWLPSKLEKQVELMEAEPACAMCYHDLDVFDSSNDKTLWYWNSGERRPKPVVGDAPYVAAKVVEGYAGFMGALSVMIRRNCLDEDIGYDPRLPHQGEVLIWLNALRNQDSTVRFIPEILARYRRHENNLSRLDYGTQEDIFLAIVENETVGLLNAVRRARGRRYYTRGVVGILESNGRLALSCFAQSLRYHPHSIKIVYWLARALFLVIFDNNNAEK